MQANSAALTPESDSGGKIDVAEAKRRLTTLKQGTDFVHVYFDKCIKLFEIANEGRIERNDPWLLATFMNGLNERARKIIQHSMVPDAFTARKIAIQEEMFATASSLQPGIEEDRMHKLEILAHCQWEKLRSLDGKFAHVQHEVHQVKKDVGSIKESFLDIQKTLNTIMTLTLKNAEEQEAAKQAEKENLEKEKLEKEKEKVPEVVQENKEEDNILNRVVTAQESLVAKLDSLEKIDKIQKVAALNYEWIRQVYNDVKKLSQGGLKVETPSTPGTAPSASPNPQATTASPVITIKRSLSSMEEHPPQQQPPPKKARRNEKEALDLLHKKISDQEYQNMVNGDIMDHIGALIKVYSDRADNIWEWMAQNRKPVKRPCSLCGNFEHHGYECTTITDIDERKSILREKMHCMECSNWHKGKCNLHLDCRICNNAKRDNFQVMGGVAHCRMFCPLQEEYHAARRTSKILSDAQMILLK